MSLLFCPCYGLFLFGLAFVEQGKKNNVIQFEQVGKRIKRPYPHHKFQPVPKVLFDLFGKEGIFAPLI